MITISYQFIGSTRTAVDGNVYVKDVAEARKACGFLMRMDGVFYLCVEIAGTVYQACRMLGASGVVGSWSWIIG